MLVIMKLFLIDNVPKEFVDIEEAIKNLKT